VVFPVQNFDYKEKYVDYRHMKPFIFLNLTTETYRIWEKFNTFFDMGWHSSFVIPPDYVFFISFISHSM